MHRILFKIGPFTLYTYGFCIAVAFLLAAVLIMRDAKKINLSKDIVLDCLLALLVGGLIGGRLLYVLINWQFYLRQPLRIFLIYEGGLAYQGALLMGGIFGALICYRKKLSFFEMSDLFIPYVALGQSIGRIGCFLNGCCYGHIVDNPFGVMFPQEAVKRFPIQLVYSVILLGIFGLLIFIRNKKAFKGEVFSWYLIFYGTLRFFVDFFRGDELVSVRGLHLSQIIGLVIFFSGICMYAFLKKHKR